MRADDRRASSRPPRPTLELATRAAHRRIIKRPIPPPRSRSRSPALAKFPHDATLLARGRRATRAALGRIDQPIALYEAALARAPARSTPTVALRLGKLYARADRAARVRRPARARRPTAWHELDALHRERRAARTRTRCGQQVARDRRDRARPRPAQPGPARRRRARADRVARSRAVDRCVRDADHARLPDRSARRRRSAGRDRRPRAARRWPPAIATARAKLERLAADVDARAPARPATPTRSTSTRCAPGPRSARTKDLPRDDRRRAQARDRPRDVVPRRRRPGGRSRARRGRRRRPTPPSICRERGRVPARGRPATIDALDAFHRGPRRAGRSASSTRST